MGRNIQNIIMTLHQAHIEISIKSIWKHSMSVILLDLPYRHSLTVSAFILVMTITTTTNKESISKSNNQINNVDNGMNTIESVMKHTIISNE